MSALAAPRTATLPQAPALTAPPFLPPSRLPSRPSALPANPPERAELNWDGLNAKTLPAPWIPKVTNPLDTSNFDPYDEADDVIERYVDRGDRWDEGF